MPNPFSDTILCKQDPGLYHFINQGCLNVDSIDDKEEMDVMDVGLLLRASDALNAKRCVECRICIKSLLMSNTCG